MRKLASVKIVDSVSHLKNFDFLDVVSIGGWRTVIANRCDTIKAGDKVVYFEIDSAIPFGDPRFEFLGEKRLEIFKNGIRPVEKVYKIKTIKLHGQISQGLVMPLEEFPEVIEANLTEVNTDLTDFLHVKNYDEMAKYYFSLNHKTSGGNAGRRLFPSFIKKTDEERLQNLIEYFEIYKDTEFEVTEKADGSSATYIWSPSNRPENPYYICSRNFEIIEDENMTDDLVDPFIYVSRIYDIKNLLMNLDHEYAIQGEIIGPGINGNRDNNVNIMFKVFRIFDITENRWLTSEERTLLCETSHLDHVKVIKNNFKVFQKYDTMEKMIEFADGRTDRGNLREGLVFKSKDGNTSFKVINVNYLLS